jgi:O-antigen/teichoic acid export membrane protein
VGFGVLFVYSAISIYMEPQIYKHSDDRVASENLLAHQTFLCVVAALLIGAAAVAAYDLVATEALDAGYLASRQVIPIIIAAYLLHPVYNQGIFRLTSVGRTKVIAIASGFAAVMNIGLNLWLIPLYGTIGAAIATLLSYAILAAVTFGCSLALSDRAWRDVRLPGLVIGSFAIATAVALLAQVLSAAIVLLASAAAVVLLNPARSAHYIKLARGLAVT